MILFFCYSSSSDSSKVNAKTSTTHFRYRKRSGSNDSIDDTLQRKPNNLNSSRNQIQKQMISSGNSFNSSSSVSYEDDNNNYSALNQ
jgi:hypothetical protein